MKLFVLKLRTALVLGPANLARALGYFASVRIGLNPVRRIRAAVAQAPFFHAHAQPPLSLPLACDWSGTATLFSRWPIALSGGPPDWLANPLTGARVAQADRPWWRIPDFDERVGDIKLIWELSRFDWVLALAQAYRRGDDQALGRLNDWLADWCRMNPPYLGPNWKCGQEASIRVLHLAMAARVLGERQQARGLQDLVALHLQRITPTIQYAIAQDNNHGTSEAAALFVGGSWLAAHGDRRAASWAALGRRCLENRSWRLIGPQGSFSQYSLNYHRLMLDTFCIAEVWRRHAGLHAFSPRMMERLQAATQWLRHMVHPATGDAPNVGANDGARILQLTPAPYRDHRPSVQLAMALFAGKAAYPEGPWDHALRWLGIERPLEQAQAAQDYLADDGGFALARRRDCMVMLRYPRFRFRPSQADALHLDVWLGDHNLLRDGGTYSYNTEARWMDYFGGTASHNTIAFDDRDQMPRISRFLFGHWLKSQVFEPLSRTLRDTCMGVEYADWRRASHRRRIRLRDDGLQVKDTVAGFERKAVLRWRFMPGSWSLAVASPTALTVTSGGHSPVTLNIHSTVPMADARITEGWESRHYLEKTAVPVLEVEIREPGTFTTELSWTA